MRCISIINSREYRSGTRHYRGEKCCEGAITERPTLVTDFAKVPRRRGRQAGSLLKGKEVRRVFQAERSATVSQSAVSAVVRICDSGMHVYTWERRGRNNSHTASVPT